MKKPLMICGIVTSLAAGTAAPLMAAPWVRSFVVGSYEYAFRYGGRPDYHRASEIAPGVDCPHGSGIHFTGEEQTRNALIRQKWRTQQEIDWIVKPPGLDQVRAPAQLRFWIWDRAISYRGYKKDVETYVNPFAAEDPGQPAVTSRIGEGFNLDGRNKANDFVSPTGEKGIDNALYRAWGCDAPWRGDGTGTLYLRANDKMLDGLYTMVFRVSGNQDPQNDSNATLEVGYSPDKIVRDARGGVATDYSYRILQSAQYTKLKATVRNGVVDSEQVEHLHTPRIAWFYDQTGDAHFRKGRVRLNIAKDGQSAIGLLGGYRDWRDLYAENTFSQDGGQQSIRDHEDGIALYYALRRNADGMLNAKTGKYDGISTAYRVRLTSAYVVDPERPMAVPKLMAEEKRKAAYEATKLAMTTATSTLVPQLVPPGTTEAGAGYLERELFDLPSKDFFLGLYRQRYDGEDENGIPPWMQEFFLHFPNPQGEPKQSTKAVSIKP